MTFSCNRKKCREIGQDGLRTSQTPPGKQRVCPAVSNQWVHHTPGTFLPDNRRNKPVIIVRAMAPVDGCYQPMGRKIRWEGSPAVGHFFSSTADVLLHLPTYAALCDPQGHPVGVLSMAAYNSLYAMSVRGAATPA